MTKDVLVRVFGLQKNISDDKIEVKAPGSFYIKGDKKYVVYEETDVDTGKVIKTLLKFNDKRVEIIRSGAVSVSFDFEMDKHSTSSLVTPYGTLLLEIDTERVEIEESAQQIEMRIEYTLGMDGEPYTDCGLDIIIMNEE